LHLCCPEASGNLRIPLPKRERKGRVQFLPDNEIPGSSTANEQQRMASKLTKRRCPPAYPSHSFVRTASQRRTFTTRIFWAALHHQARHHKIRAGSGSTSGSTAQHAPTFPTGQFVHCAVSRVHPVRKWMTLILLKDWEQRTAHDREPDLARRRSFPANARRVEVNVNITDVSRTDAPA
jgi:hypothetical protein